MKLVGEDEGQPNKSHINSWLDNPRNFYELFRLFRNEAVNVEGWHCPIKDRDQLQPVAKCESYCIGFNTDDMGFVQIVWFLLATCNIKISWCLISWREDKVSKWFCHLRGASCYRL